MAANCENDPRKAYAGRANLEFAPSLQMSLALFSVETRMQRPESRFPSFKLFFTTGKIYCNIIPFYLALSRLFLVQYL